MENKIPSTRRRGEKYSTRSHIHTPNQRPRTISTQQWLRWTTNQMFCTFPYKNGEFYSKQNWMRASPKQYLLFQANILSTLFTMFAKCTFDCTRELLIHVSIKVFAQSAHHFSRFCPQLILRKNTSSKKIRFAICCQISTECLWLITADDWFAIHFFFEPERLNYQFSLWLCDKSGGFDIEKRQYIQ